MITFKYSRHGSQRSRLRHLSEAECLTVLNGYAYSTPANKPGRIRLHGHPRSDGSRLTIIVSWPPEADTVILITGYIEGGVDGG